MGQRGRDAGLGVLGCGDPLSAALSSIIPVCFTVSVANVPARVNQCTLLLVLYGTTVR